MKVVASTDWRDGIPFETPIIVAEILPGDDARCSACGGDSELIARTELWAIKHRHPRHHDGYVRFYCLEHRPVVQPIAVEPVRERPAARGARLRAAPRPPAAAEKERAMCPDCFVEVAATGTCGICGWTGA
ncbi:MAG TPA: glucose-6-phosphate dehydrogenase [Microbacterium sp.]|nr:glucose-6-phosphate dehydrogenase [Microbacterium sp.]